ncbi:23S rRNA (adenine(2503)-C(2))-methyltransferase RlmN [bacterium]|nr:23S rRNA (adenine(2503)-C(2))-methyltransferase RlmN [bacterium]
MIETFATTHNLPEYKIEQFNNQYYKQAISSFDQLSTWSKELRELLKQEVDFSTLDHIKDNHSSDGKTIKTEFKTKDGFDIETVLMRYKDGRNSVCVSCMSGCPVDCSFCATGKMGFNRNLTYKEIVDQVLHHQRMLVPKGKRVTNVVYMGMGEPMLNLTNIEKSIDIVNNPNKLGIGIRHITISTVGYVPQLKEFFSKGYNPRLALSLHAPNQKLRASIMSTISNLYPLEQLMEFSTWYENEFNKRITYEYTLIKGINDQPEHAIELSQLLYKRLAFVNLIKFNPYKDIPYEAPSNNTVERFRKILDNRGINTTIRHSMGSDIGGACGQLHPTNSSNTK